MKVTFGTEHLQVAVASMARVVRARPAHEWQGYLLLSVSTSGTVLCGADDGIDLEIPVVEEDCAEFGKVLLKPKLASAILKESTGDTVEISDAGGRACFKTGTAVHQLLTSDASQFRRVEVAAKRDAVRLNTEDLFRALTGTVYAADETGGGRYALDGIMFHVVDRVLRLVGTDTRRMAIADVPIQSDALDFASLNLNQKAIIPNRALKLLLNVFRGRDEIDYWSDGSAAVFSSGGSLLSARLLSGRWPDYERLSFQSDHTVEVDSKRLASLVRQASVATDVTTRSIVFAPEGKSLHVRSKDQASKSSADLVYDVECPASGEIRLNPRFVLDALKPDVGGDGAVLNYGGPNDPVKIECGGAACTLMPVSA